MVMRWTEDMDVSHFIYIISKVDSQPALSNRHPVRDSANDL